MDHAEQDGTAAISSWRATRSTERLVREFSVPDFDDSGWTPIDVPLHWQVHDEFADFSGTLLYRADLTVPSLQPGQRRWLRFGGVCYSGDVFLDGAYLGQTEGYFTPHRFEITDLAARAGRSVLAIEVGAPNNAVDEPKRTITGWFADAPGSPVEWNPAGIWQPVDVIDTGPVAFRYFRAICTAADTKRAVISLRAVLFVAESGDVELVSEVAGATHSIVHTAARGENQVEWQVEVDNPELWSPHGLGDQPIFDLRVQARVSDGTISDRKHRRIGFRSTSMQDFILRVNGTRVFMRGINVAPFRLDLAGMTPDELHAEALSIRDAGFNLIRVRSHVTRLEFYDACDELGILVWQDMPLTGSYSRGIYGQAQRQTRDMIDLLAHHPSIVVWGGHNRPHTNDKRTTATPNLRQQQIPSWNRTVLDRAIRRILTSADSSRKTVAHSDVAPHIPHLSGSDLGLFFGWFDGDAADLAEYAATLPRFVRFVSDMGSQALPDDPDRDLDMLLSVTGAETDTLNAVIPPQGHADSADWINEMRAYQAEVLKTSIEALRVLKYRPVGGFCAGLWRGSGPGLSRALIDADGTPRPALSTVSNALSPVLPMIHPPVAAIHARTSTPVAIYVCSDLPRALSLEIEATITDSRGVATRRFAGEISADDVVYVGEVTIRGGRIGDLAQLELAVDIDGGRTVNSYRFTAA